MSDWRTQISEDAVRDYAAGQVSWREIRHANQLDDFQVMLQALAALELKLPRAKPDRASAAKQWLAEALVERSASA